MGSESLVSTKAVAAEDAPNDPAAEAVVPQIPQRLQLTADRQRFDVRRNVTIAEGSVRLQLGAGQLIADRVEFDANFQTVFARGAVRLSRNNQVFQASALRYNLSQNEGELDDVYGVIDLDAMQGVFNVADPSPTPTEQQARPEPAPMACPPK